MTRYAALWLILLASLVTLLNAVKPLTIDDPIYLAYARQIAEHPTDPYGFLLLGTESAHHTLAPPVVPYCWAVAIRLFGDRPVLWKLAFFPFSLLFVFSLHRLCRRFAAGLEMPLTAMLVLSPAFLPAWNLMLDVPAMALSLAALVLFIDSVRRGSLGHAAVAGLVAGVAMQTKYTAFVTPAILLLYGLLNRRIGYGILATILALLIFASWEGFTAARYGESHFLIHVGQRRSGLLVKYHLLLPLVVTLGGVASWAGLLALVALGALTRRVLIATAAVAVGFALIAFVPDTKLSGSVFGLFGTVMVLGALAVCRRLHRENATPRIEWFLLLWLVVETVGYVALTPYPAARRVLGVIVVGTLLAGRLASQTCVTAERRRLVFVPVAVSIVLGFGYYVVDFRESRAQAKAVQQAARWIHRRDPHATIWFLGTLGFHYYAEHAGMTRLVPDSVMLPGSWYVTDGTCPKDERYHFPHDTPIQLLDVRDGLPLRTQQCYYGSGTPLEHLSGPRAVVRIYRRR